LGKNQHNRLNGYTVDECVFKECSFKEVTFFFPPEDKEEFNKIGRFLWLTDPVDRPTVDKDDPKQIEDRSDESAKVAENKSTAAKKSAKASSKGAGG
jgi:hypothetical protein